MTGNGRLVLFSNSTSKIQAMNLIPACVGMGAAGWGCEFLLMLSCWIGNYFRSTLATTFKLTVCQDYVSGFCFSPSKNKQTKKIPLQSIHLFCGFLRWSVSQLLCNDLSALLSALWLMFIWFISFGKWCLTCLFSLLSSDVSQRFEVNGNINTHNLKN